MKVLRVIFAALCAIFCLLGNPVLAEEEPDSNFEIIGLDDRPNLHDSVRLAANRGRNTIRDKTSLEWAGKVLIVWADEELFLEKTGFRPENSAAAASPSQMTIWVNEASWNRATEREQQRTMTHELGHILVGSLPGGKRLPLWANEGIVMHLAGQWSFDEHFKLLIAHAFGTLPKLSSMEEEFPRDGESQLLAYRMSYSAVDIVAQNYGDQPGEVRRLLQRLEDPFYGPMLAEEFWDAFRVEGWQLATERSMGSRLSTGVIVSTGTGSIFLLISILFVFAYLKVRSRSKTRDQQYEEEREPWEESLTDEDIQDIYGDREDRW